MPRGDKPYRVYRGGRTKGKVPLQPKPDRARPQDGRAPRDATRRPSAPPRPRNRRRRIWLGALVMFAVLVAWAVTSYLAVSSGVEAANARLGAAPVEGTNGLLLSQPTTLLLLGTDHSRQAERQGARRSDSIILLRTDPSRHRLAYLSVPRDLRVDVPGYGPSKVNAAFQFGGTALAIRTIRGFTGIPVNHVVIVDFNRFKDLVDALGGITINVPERIVSNNFDCPYPTRERCERWGGWRFRAGKQTMDGRKALIYSRIRENRLNPAENDLTRGERQQAVLQAIMNKLVSPRTLARLPFIGDELLEPLATDLSAAQFLQFGWLRFRAPPERTLHCRLGGTPSDFGGQSFIVATEENRNVIAMFTGAAAPQPPLPGSGPFGPGCVVGSAQRR